jgi:hypothetical protein
MHKRTLLRYLPRNIILLSFSKVLSIMALRFNLAQSLKSLVFFSVLLWTQNAYSLDIKYNAQSKDILHEAYIYLLVVLYKIILIMPSVLPRDT